MSMASRKQATIDTMVTTAMYTLQPGWMKSAISLDSSLSRRALLVVVRGAAAFGLGAPAVHFVVGEGQVRRFVETLAALAAVGVPDDAQEHDQADDRDDAAQRARVHHLIPPTAVPRLCR